VAARDGCEPVSTSAAAAHIIVADTSPIRTFVEAGGQRAFAAFLGDRVRITVDVARELEDAASTLPGLRSFLKAWPPHPPVDLPADLKLQAADILGFVANDLRASLQDLGEVTAVLLAQRMRDTGECDEPLLLVDDQRHGKALARLRGLPFLDTPGLIIEMVCVGALPQALGAKVWRAAFSDRSKWPLFDESLQRALRDR
jgi:hypothetical protein